MIPARHRQYVRDTLAKFGVPELAEGEAAGRRITGWMEQVARGRLDVAFDYPIKLLANALGSPPADVLARAHDRGVLVAALAGSARHARNHRDAGVTELPRDPNGKLCKRRLRDPYWAGRTRPV